MVASVKCIWPLAYLGGSTARCPPPCLNAIFFNKNGPYWTKNLKRISGEVHSTMPRFLCREGDTLPHSTYTAPWTSRLGPIPPSQNPKYASIPHICVIAGFMKWYCQNTDVETHTHRTKCTTLTTKVISKNVYMFITVNFDFRQTSLFHMQWLVSLLGAL